MNIDYTPQGSYQELGGVNCYVTGDSKDVAIIGIYDIFGFSAQVGPDCSIHRASADTRAVVLTSLPATAAASHTTPTPCRLLLLLPPHSLLPLLSVNIPVVQASV